MAAGKGSAKTKPTKGKDKDGADVVKMLLRNRRARHDYDISQTLEAGIALVGSEVKSLRDQRGSIADGHVIMRRGEAWLVGVQILEYPWAHQLNHDPMRERKLLLHKRELAKLDVALAQRGFTLVPMAIYVKNGKIKLELGVAKGKKQYEKRQDLKEAEAKREIDRAVRGQRAR